ncbi:hypothetical protein P5673_019521 [Acropora cervicornis]|uniref:Uncharacterized protein n=1 Tax=Acropora cervicornis TaxID=6130 RepID=A0AAD9V1L7_ACRCE|nr:hypothetical protein P5673_019521 [Acropora cervicornis]
MPSAPAQSPPPHHTEQFGLARVRYVFQSPIPPSVGRLLLPQKLQYLERLDETSRMERLFVLKDAEESEELLYSGQSLKNPFLEGDGRFRLYNEKWCISGGNH